ncbi:hypothetical protein [Nostoc sp. PCC 9305]
MDLLIACFKNLESEKRIKQILDCERHSTDGDRIDRIAGKCLDFLTTNA